MICFIVLLLVLVFFRIKKMNFKSMSVSWLEKNMEDINYKGCCSAHVSYES